MLLMRKFKVESIDIGRKFKDKNDFLWEFSISNLGLIDILKMRMNNKFEHKATTIMLWEIYHTLLY